MKFIYQLNLKEKTNIKIRLQQRKIIKIIALSQRHKFYG